jgi:hypothetical protein
MENLKTPTVKKEWKTPEVYLLDTVEAKHLSANEAYFTKTSPNGIGGYKFYHNNNFLGTAPVKLSSVNS